ncbi:MAG TPA: thioredoxin domain-containing protein [Gemmataceae bacterium]|jgi:hypothetical protein
MNRLASESSLYLRQHAYNPVDWHPWGPEALEKAKREDKPIFLSVGYSACHWCHVMEHESFEDADTARLLNEHFVPVKVDREERPDVDAIYMAAVQALNHGQGGWPMSVWLTPDLHPFYAGTYYPPRDSYGRPSFRRVLTALAEAWRDRRDEVVNSAGHITDVLRRHGQPGEIEGELTVGLLRIVPQILRQMFDARHGGFGTAPKFPHAIDLRLLLRAWHRFGDADALAMVRTTLDHMAAGGIYDHLGGGFHRYSVDERWLVPHFEKMLYDNALLSVAYLEAHQATGEPFYRRVVEETLDYVLREMTAPVGPFYSTQDADSEGVEGKFYVWSEREVRDVLGGELADVFEPVYDVTPGGNWEGHTILHRPKTDEQDAALLKMDGGGLREKLAEARKKLLAVRSKRKWPGRDEKILTSWNGLMIAAFARAGAVLDRGDYTTAAIRAADYILTNMRTPDGRLYRTTAVGSAPKIDAYLEDYAFLIDALVQLYGATFEVRWLRDAEQLAGIMVDRFADREAGGFFTTPAGQGDLIMRLKDQHDASIPSGSGMAVTGLLRLAEMTGTARWRQEADRGLRALRGVMHDAPTAAAQALIALDFALGPVEEVAAVGSGEEARRVLRAALEPFRPRRVVAYRDPAKDDPEAAKLPLLADKPPRGPVTTYICQNYACQAPIVGAEAAEGALR